MSRWDLALAALAVLATGCSVTLRAGRPARIPPTTLTLSEAGQSACIRAPAGPGNPFREALPGPVRDPALTRYLEPLPARVRRTATAAGLEPLIARLLEVRAEAHGAPTLESATLRQEIAERAASLQTQLLATEFECECVIGLMDRTLRRHDDEERARQTALTIASLVSGAGFSLAAGTWDLVNGHVPNPAAPDGPLVTAIVGAVATTALGAAVLAPHPREIVFVHEHNLLAPIRTGADPDLLYPVFVFRMLTLPLPAGGPTPRDELLAAWTALEEEAVPPARRASAASLMFGRGGVYDAEVLTYRRRVFEALESALDSLSRDVDLLNHSLSRALENVDAPTASPRP